MIALLVAFALVAADDAASQAVEVKGWALDAGDRGHVIVDNAPACAGRDVYDELAKYRQAKDQAGVTRMVEGKAVSLLPRGTPVLVVQSHRPSPTPRGKMSGSELQASIQAAASAAGKVYPVEVRILDGPLKGELRLLSEADFGRLAAPRPVSAKQAKLEKKADPAGRAASLLRAARNLEAAGKADGAAAFYRQLVKDFPGTPQAAEAARRLSAAGR